MKLIILTAMMIFVITEAQAIPKKYNSCEADIDFKEIESGSGVVFNENCTQAYVLPPKGQMRIDGVRPTGNLRPNCSDYSSVQRSISNQFRQVESLTTANNYVFDRIDMLNEYLGQGLTPVGMSMVDLLKELSELNKLVSENMTFIDDMRTKNINSRRDFAQMEGGTARFQLDSKYNEVIQAYKDANPEIHFLRMPLKQSYVSITDRTIDYANINPSMSAILSIESSNIGSLPVLTNLYVEQPEGEGVKFPGNYFGDSTSGSLVFSALGMCPLVEEFGYTMDGFNMDDVPLFHANVTYQYEVLVNRHHKVEINLHQLAKRVQQSISKGGFLSRKNIQKLTEKTEHESWIKVEVLSEDVDHAFTEEYTKSVVQEQMQFFLDQVSHVRFGTPGSFPQAALPEGENGADNAAGALKKCPHMYCQIGSYALKFISSTFGKTSALSEYIKTEDAWSIREVKESKMVPLVGGYSFD